MPAVLPTNGPLFYPASPRVCDEKLPRASFITQLAAVKASPCVRAASAKPVSGKYLVARAEMLPARRIKLAAPFALNTLKAGPSSSSSDKKSTDKPKTATTARSSGRPASTPAARRKKKVKTKTSYYVKSTTNTFSLVKITAERSEKTFADRQR